MPYVRIGLDPIHNGKRLFDLLCNLKNFGRERIIYSTLEQKYQEPSFYRILLAQLEMDLDKPHTFGKEKPWTQTGTSSRIVTERVYRGMRYTEPFNLTAELNKQMQFADYRLVPKDEEELFCRWNEVQDYDPVKHAPERSKYMEMPPLMRLVVARNRKAKNEQLSEADFLLPAHKIYDSDVRLTDTVESYKMSQYLNPEYLKQIKDFDLNLIPTETWNQDKIRSLVGHRCYPGYTENTSRFGYEELKRRDDEEERRLTENAPADS